MHWQLLARTRN